MRFLLTFLLASLTIYTHAQKVEWLESAGGQKKDYGNDIAVDEAGNSYITGVFEGKATFDTITLNSPGNKLFFAKYDSLGNVEWIDTATNTSRVLKNTVDQFGNVYTVGGGGSKFSNGVKVQTGDFLIKHNKNDGSIQWVDSLPVGFDYENLTVDKNGNIYIAGDFGKSIYIGSDTFKTSSFSDALLLKYDSSGQYLWGKQNGYTSSSSILNDVATDSYKNSYTVGTFFDTVKFGSIKKSEGQSSRDVFMVKHDSSGQPKWLKVFEGADQQTITGVTVNEQNEIAITGRYYDSIQVGNLKAKTLNATSTNLFVAALDTAGITQWLQEARTPDTGFIWAKDIISNDDQTYIAGFNQPSGSQNVKFYFGPDTLSVNYSNAIRAPFITKLGQDGKFLWTFSSANSQTSIADAIGVDSLRNAFAIGGYRNKLKLKSKSISGQGQGDIFLTKISDISITIATTLDSFYCTNDSLQVPYTTKGDFDKGNTFSVQLSDSTGDFSSPYSIGSLKDTTSDTIQARIPDTIPSGTGYKLRVVSDSPVVTSFATGSDIETKNGITATLTADDPICQGDTAQFTLSDNGDTYQWASDYNLSNDTIAAPKAYPDTTTRYGVTITDTTVGCVRMVYDTIKVRQDSIPPRSSIQKLTFVDSQGIEVRFDSVKDGDFDGQYHIYRKADSGTFSLDTTLTDTTVYLDTSTYPNKERYCYYIATSDTCGNQGYSDNHCLHRLTGKPGNFRSKLSWQPYTGDSVKDYIVQRATNPGWLNRDTVPATDTSYEDQSLSCKDTFTYRIKARKQSDSFPSLSNEVTVSPQDTTKPRTPDVQFVTVKSDSVTALRWETSSGDVDRYVLYRKPASGTYQALDTVTGRLDTSYTDSLSEAIDQAYCYQVSAIDSCAGNESPKSIEHCTINVTASTTGCQQQIDLNWNAYTGFDSLKSYWLYRKREGRSRQLLTTLDASTTTYADTTVNFNYRYCYDVVAIDVDGDTARSNDSCGQTFEPNTPEVFSASKIKTDKATGQVKIKWNRQQGKPRLAFQRLYYQAPDSTNFSVIKDSIPLSQDTFIHGSLNTKFKDHRYYLVTVDNCGNESDSTAIHKTMELQFDVGQLLHDLSWTPYEGWPIARYEVQRREGGQFKTKDSLPAGDTAILKRPEPCNFPISYRIKAVDSNGNFAYSDTGINKAIDTVKPDRATLENVTVTQDSIVKITFNGADSLDIFSYDVMRQRAGGTYQLAERVIFSTSGGNFTVYDTTDTRSDRLCYTVLTQDSCLNTVSADSFCATQLEGQPENLQNQLSWHPFDGYPVDSQYVLEKNGAGYDTLARLGSTDTNYLHNNLRCNRPHSYKILSFEQGGNRQTLSDSIRLTPFDTLKPAAPNFRKATVQNSDSIQITWDTSTDIDVNQYEIFYAARGDSFQSLTIEPEQNQQLNSFTHQAINPENQSYCYYVKAIDSCSDVRSLPSDTHCVIELSAEGGQRENHLSWRPYRGAKVDSYQVQRLSGNTWQRLNAVPGNDTTYTDDSSTRCNIAYDYRIRAEWNDGQFWTSKSDTARAIPFDTVNPKAPYIEAFSIEGPDSAKVTWQLSDEDVSRYELSLKTQMGTWQTRDTVGIQTSYTFGGLNTLDSQYCTRLVAIDSCSANRSPFSTVHCAPELEGQPGQKENLLSWEAYKGWDSAKAYYIYNQNPLNPGWQIIDTVKGTDTGYQHTGIPCNRQQFYQVEAINDSGFSAFSDSIALTPFDTVAPDAPAIQYVSVKNPDTIEGVFDTADAVDLGKYVVYASASGNAYQAIDTIVDTGQSRNHFTHTGIRPDTRQYCYKTRSIDSCAGNISSFSQKHCAVELQGQAGNLETNLNWQAYEGFTNPTYLIQRKGITPTWQTLGSRTDTFFNDTTAKVCNAIYTYRVLTVSPTGSDTSYSDTLNLKPFDTIAPPVPQLRYASVKIKDEVEIEWEWNQSSDQKYFEVWRDQGNGNYTNLDTIRYDSQYVDQTARPGQTAHQYYIRSIDSCSAGGTLGQPGNRSNPSDTDRIMVPQVSTGACRPENRLIWNAYDDLPEGTDQYEIYRSQQPATSNPFNLQTTNNEQQTTYLDTNLNDTTTYCYRIKAVDSQSGYKAWTDSICMEPFVYPAPDSTIFTRASVQKTDTFNGAITLDWDRYNPADTFARGYYIYHRTNNTAHKRIANINNLNKTSYRHQSINTSDSNNYYHVRVYNLCDVEGPATDTHRTMDLELTNYNLATGINWTPYEGFPVQTYEIRRSENGAPFNVIKSTSDTGFIDSNVRCGIKYSYEIRAIASSGSVVSLSDSQSVIGYDTIPPDKADLHEASVTKTSATDGKVELLFDGANQANRKGYYIYRATGSNAFQGIDTINTNQRTNIPYTDSSLNTQVSILQYYIRSVDSCGNVALPSDTHRTIYLDAEPKNGYNQLNWIAYQGWEGRSYTLQRKERSSNTWQGLKTFDSSTLRYVDSAVTCFVTYDYRVLAEENNTAYEVYSNVDTAQTYEIRSPIPPEPGRASVTSTGEGNGSINITWQRSRSADATSYALFRSTNNVNYRLVDTVIGTSYTDQNLNTYNEDYYYKVKTIDSCRNISDSFSTVHRTINLDAEGGNEVNILTWNSYEGQPVERYRILRGGTELYTVNGNTTRFRDEQVICDSFYNYEIKAVLDSGYEAFSNVDSAKSFDTKAPESVYLRRATVDRFNDVVELKWDQALDYDAASYEIYRNILDESGTEKIATVEGKQQTTYYDTIELADEEVCYEVRVLDRCDNASGFSNRGCIIRPEVEALDLKNQIVWPTYQIWRSGVRDYEVFKQMDSAKYRSIGRTDSSKRTFTDEELSDTADEFCYYIRVRGWNTEEYSRSTKICIEQPAVVHIPNSFSPGITPGVNDAFGPVGLYIENYTLKIYNRWGEEVFSTSDGEKWDGTYEGKLVSTGVYTYKIVIFGKDGSTEEFRGTVNVIR